MEAQRQSPKQSATQVLSIVFHYRRDFQGSTSGNTLCFQRLSVPHRLLPSKVLAGRNLGHSMDKRQQISPNQEKTKEKTAR